ncbi:hypothetical protein ALC56_11110 [Trachymyrmex septentrionalis]|uniref:Uncharacterized protein n=1 Tax=Trachymyrmex septentrionalis TaxID=34720 RepID=A0A195F365_9HYME|nr:hypothetical protein ALC56_11110 [Trachymyrmex septentrionalis]
MFLAQMSSRLYPARLNIVEFSYCSVLITFPELLSEQVPDNRRINSRVDTLAVAVLINEVTPQFPQSPQLPKESSSLLSCLSAKESLCNIGCNFSSVNSSGNSTSSPTSTSDMTSDSKILLLSTIDSLSFTDIVEVDEDFLDSTGDVVSRSTCITFNFDITIYLIILIIDQGLSSQHIWRHSESLRPALPVDDIARRMLNIFSIIV